MSSQKVGAGGMKVLISLDTWYVHRIYQFTNGLSIFMLTEICQMRRVPLTTFGEFPPKER